MRRAVASRLDPSFARKLFEDGIKQSLVLHDAQKLQGAIPEDIEASLSEFHCSISIPTQMAVLYRAWLQLQTCPLNLQ